ncbi:MAG: hypothetical protein IPK74_25630 [Deltaproteobacteria bacterium]|nr:hypothetical protein [Deltaproteobacteria bacterium]
MNPERESPESTEETQLPSLDEALLAQVVGGHGLLDPLPGAFLNCDWESPVV